MSRLEQIKEWCLRVSTAFLFYFHILLTGVAIAAATTYLAALVGAPAPRMVPVVSQNGSVGGAVLLWLFAGPIALMRFVVRTVAGKKPWSMMSMGALIGSLVWAFCLGILTLETIFQIFQA